MDIRNTYVNPRVLRWGITIVVLIIAAILVIPQFISSVFVIIDFLA